MLSIKSLNKSNFIIILRSAVYTPFSRQEHLRLTIAYEDFLRSVNRVVQSQKSYLEKLRIFTCAYEVIDLIKRNMADRTSLRYHYAQSACTILDFEKKAILLQLKYPNVINSTRPDHTSPFRLSKNFTLTDLMEIITSLHALGFFCMPDGTPAALSKISREFGALCGVKIKNPDNSRWAILNRKIKLTHFLDILRNTLVDLSQK